MWKWLESLIDPIVKKITKGYSRKKTGKEISDDEYKNIKDKGLDYLSSGSTGDTSLDDYLDSNIPNSAKPVVDMVNGIGQGADWAKDQIESLTGDKTNEVNQEIADQNLEFQKEKFEYDQALQQQMFEREDTSYQRTVNDMRLAGLNPLNMQQTNGAGAQIATTAPQNNFQHQMTNQLGLMHTIFDSAMQAKMTSSNHSLQSAQANLINQQAENQRIKNIYESDVLATQLAGLKYDNNNKFFEVNNNLRDTLFNQFMGWTRDMPDWLKQNSARMNYKPFDWNQNSKQDFMDVLSNPSSHFYNIFSNPANLDKDNISSKLLSDDLLTATLGIFGNILKGLFK